MSLFIIALRCSLEDFSLYSEVVETVAPSVTFILVLADTFILVLADTGNFFQGLV